MEINESLSQIANLWTGFKAGKTIKNSELVYQIVHKKFPEILKTYLPKQSPLKPKGSAGEGNVVKAPWIATFHPEITMSARHGYYPVYLFSDDLQRVYLCLALGVTQFSNQYGRNKKAKAEIKKAAAFARETISLMEKPTRFNIHEIKLSDKKPTWPSSSHEASIILAYPAYEIDALPPEIILIEDYKSLCNLYINLFDNPSYPSTDELFLSSVTPHQSFESEPIDFAPRKRKKRTNKSNTNPQKRRFSKSAKKIGDAGEKVVMESEIKKLITNKREDLVEKIVNHAARLEFIGWDITSFDETSGEEIFIEVKSSVSKTINFFDITKNEWESANSASKKEKYKIYLVTNVFSEKPTIEIIHNPAKWISEKRLEISPAVYTFSLYDKNS